MIGELADSPGLVRVADLATRAAVSAPTEGRALYAGLRALDVPEEPVARLWYAATLLLKAQRTADRSVMRAALQVRKKRSRLTPRGQEGYGEGMCASAASQARSAGSYCNRPTCRRSTAFTCLSTSNSASFASPPRNARTTRLNTRHVST